MKTKFYYLIGFVLVRPIRYLFRRMIWASTLRLKPQKPQYKGDTWRLPNLHWWILYKTVYKFFHYLDWDGWRPFAVWGDRYLKRHTLLSGFIKWLGSSTAGVAQSGGRCFHCNAEEGCQVLLSEDESGKHFKDVKTWTVATQEGTDHCFSGITVCPRCGFESEYSDGSL